MRTAHQSGFAHRVRVRVSCEDCLANERTTRPRKSCEVCHGRGYAEEWRNRDPYAISDTVQPYGIDQTVKLGHVSARDAEIDRLEQQTAPAWKSPEDELEDANRHPYGWEIARKQMYDRFDYRALDVALDELLKTLPGVSPRSARGLAFLLERMPEKIRAPRVVAAAAAPARKVDPLERNALMVERAREGASPSEIAVEFRVSIKTVYRVVAKAA